MSDDAPSPLLADPADAGETPLTPDLLEGIVEDFRRWTQEHVEQADALLAETPRAPLDVAAVVGQFTALRQEVNLQTKNSRNQLEQNAQALEQLTRSLQTIRDQQQRLRDVDTAALDDRLRPILKSMVDARDSLALAERQIRKLQDSLRLPEPVTPPPPAPNEFTDDTTWEPPLWARMLGLGGSLRSAARKPADNTYLLEVAAWAKDQQQRLVQQQELNAAFRQAVDSILTGYGMSLERLERTLASLDLVRIDCVGETFDAETMEVVEVVREPERTATEVLEEVRPGYRWRGVLFRCAQVRVARA